MKKILLLSCLVASIGVSYAQSSYAVTDGFSRADTGAQTPASSPNLIGAQWTIANGTWAINSGQLKQVGGTAGEQTIYLNTLKTLNSGAGTNFTLQATLQLNVPVTENWSFAGIVFNLQDSANYYAFRYCGDGTVQLISAVNGGVSAQLSVAGFTPVQNRPYTLTLTSVDPYNFSVSIYDTVTGTMVYTNASVVDGGGSFQDGYGGLYANANTGVMAYDNFNLAVTPAPTVPPTVLVQPVDSFGSPGSSLTLWAYIDGNPAPHLQWKFNGVSILNATNQTLTLGSFQSNNVGSYVLYATNSLGWTTTTAAAVSMYVQGDQGRDVFTRADTAPQTPASSPNQIGWQWTIANGTWAINSGQLKQVYGPVGENGEQVIYLNTLKTLNSGAGTNFTLQATLQLNAPVTENWSFAGIVFNLQDSANYYVFRYGGDGTVQLLSFVGGGLYGTIINQPGFTPVQNRPYTLTVTSVDPYTFSVSIYDTVIGTMVYANASVVDGGGSFQDGYGGLYADNNFGVMACNAFNLYVWPATFGPNYNRLSSPLLSGGGTAVLNLSGTPGDYYVLERATSLTAPIDWQPVITNTADLSGLVNFTNTSAAPQNFFRTRQP